MALTENQQKILKSFDSFNLVEKKNFHYCVEIPYFAYKNNKSEVKEWLGNLESNCSEYVSDVISIIPKCFFFFTHKEDAVLFKLIFG